jgi:hypothetical protein
MQVSLIDIQTGEENWQGSLADFFSANSDSLDRDEMADIQSTFEDGLSYFIGGGASAEFRLELIA